MAKQSADEQRWMENDARLSGKLAGMPSAARDKWWRHVDLAGESREPGGPGVVARAPSTKPPGLKGIYDPDAPIIRDEDRDAGKPGALRRLARPQLNITPELPIRRRRSMSRGSR